MSEYLDWKVGDEVVFIGFPNHINFRDGENLPEVNQKYTIREIFIHKEKLVIRLKEIVNDKRNYMDAYGEAAFRADSFRKVQKRKTDISVFTVMLNKTPQQNAKELECQD